MKNQLIVPGQEKYAEIMPYINRDPEGKNLLSMHQLKPGDIYDYIEEAEAIRQLVDSRGGESLLPYLPVKVVMMQDSTRTAGSSTSAAYRVGASADLISGMKSSAEGKGESRSDTWEAFWSQAAAICTRTPENFGPHEAALSVHNASERVRMRADARGIPPVLKEIPVINLGDGTNEHPTQTIGDLTTISSMMKTKNLEGLKLLMIGDYERYRAHRSLMIGAAALGVAVYVVESAMAKVDNNIAALLGDNLVRLDDMDDGMKIADVLYMGRYPKEYVKSGNITNDTYEEKRHQALTEDFASWQVDKKRLQQMSADSLFMHPRPRTSEVNPDIDDDVRAVDVEQMGYVQNGRMAIYTRHFGRALVK